MWHVSILYLLTGFLVVPSQAQITLDGTIGPKGSLQGPNFTIGADVGRQVGGNLFHSFGEFNIHASESATFTGPENIQNVIGRVTGGRLSEIDGPLRSEIPNANLYLLNPAGVLFGPNASLDVSGSFHVSTADSLKLSDSGQFNVTQPESSVLTSAPPVAFGFLGSNPASITIRGSSLEVTEGKTLSVVGGDIKIRGSGIPLTSPQIPSTLAARNGQTNLASVASPGEVIFSSPDGALGLQMDSFERLGSIDLSQTTAIRVGGDPSGIVSIQAGRLMIDHSFINAVTLGGNDQHGTSIDIHVTGDVILNVGEISSSSFGTGDAGQIRVVAGTVQLESVSSDLGFNIGSRAFSSGNAGNIEIMTDKLVLKDAALIQTTTFSSGAGGNITIKTGDLQLLGENGQASIASDSRSSGDAGDIDVRAESILARGGSGRFLTGLLASVGSAGTGDGGNIEVHTGSLQLLNGAQISGSISGGSGQGGNIEVTADTILISDLDPGGTPAGIFATSRGQNTTGSGGNIRITAKDLQLMNSSQIGAFSVSRGNAGNITVKTGSLKITNGSFFSSASLGLGESGSIEVEAEQVLLAGPSPKDGFTGVFAVGGVFAKGSGDIKIKTKNLEVQDGAQISARTNGRGPGGTVDVIADKVLISGIDPQSVSVDGTGAGIFASTLIFQNFVNQATGRGGNIRIQTKELTIADQATISAASTGGGDGGNIDLTAGILALIDGASITARSARSGNAGSITLNTDTFLSKNSTVTTEARQAGGGKIELSSGRIVELVDSGVTTTVQGGTGDAGNINVTTPAMALNGSTVRAQADAGNGGNITIGTDLFLASPDSVVTASSQTGVSGTVDIRGVVNNLSGSLTSLTQAYQDSPALTADRCAGRIQEGSISSFVVTGRSGIPLQPGGLLPSSLLFTQERDNAQPFVNPATAEKTDLAASTQIQWEMMCGSK